MSVGVVMTGAVPAPQGAAPIGGGVGLPGSLPEDAAFAPVWQAQQLGVLAGALAPMPGEGGQDAPPAPDEPEQGADADPAVQDLPALALWLAPTPVEVQVARAQAPAGGLDAVPAAAAQPAVALARPAEVRVQVGGAAPGASPLANMPDDAPADALPAMPALPGVPAQAARPAGEAALALPAPLRQAVAALAGAGDDATQAAAVPAQATSQATSQTSEVQPLPAAPAAADGKPAAQPLVQALAQRIGLQQAQGQDVVTVRLDPPDLGSLEIRVQQQGAGVQVVLNASHAEVGRQLAALADGLRQELQGRSGAEATVTVAQHGRQGADAGQQERRSPAWQPPETIGQALQDEQG